MKDSVKAFLDAAMETPRLFFAPIVGALQAVGHVQDAMVRTQRGIIHKRTVDGFQKNRPGQVRKMKAAKKSVRRRT